MAEEREGPRPSRWRPRQIHAGVDFERVRRFTDEIMFNKLSVTHNNTHGIAKLTSSLNVYESNAQYNIVNQ